MTVNFLCQETADLREIPLKGRFRWRGLRGRESGGGPAPGPAAGGCNVDLGPIVSWPPAPVLTAVILKHNSN